MLTVLSCFLRLSTTNLCHYKTSAICVLTECMATKDSCNIIVPVFFLTREVQLLYFYAAGLVGLL